MANMPPYPIDYMENAANSFTAPPIDIWLGLVNDTSVA